MIELPEAMHLAKEMQETVVGKKIVGCLSTNHRMHLLFIYCPICGQTIVKKNYLGGII